MRTKKSISTISYNSIDFLLERCEELIKNHVISDYMFIGHFKEADERKDHIHLWLNPNTLVDTMDLQDFFMEFNPDDVSKPFKCIDFRLSQTDDWILYNLHFGPYLASKGESREYHYMKGDIYFYDVDTFDDLYNHAFRGSDWARRNQILCSLAENQQNPAQLILNGTVPLNMASQLNAFSYMKSHYGVLDRNGREGHD